MNKNAKIRVRNRSTGSVGYTIPDLGIKRIFNHKESKDITFEELQKLTYIPGGEFILQHYLVIENDEARNELLGGVELEYAYTEADVKKLLTTGSLDELLDCLDFAPKGVIELVQKIAVEIELNDISKRRAIFEKTGFNIDNAIRINEETKEEDESVVTGGRRVATTPTKTANPTETVKERRYTVDKK
jgi:hypothetical protein